MQPRPRQRTRRVYRSGMRHLLALALLVSTPACSDAPLTCAEVYTEACRSAFDGQCSPFGLAGWEDEIACIQALSEPPRPGDVTDEYGSGAYGCRWMTPEADLETCYRLTAHQSCDTFDEAMAFGHAFQTECIAGYIPHDF